MRIIKRNGLIENISFDKITTRIKKACKSDIHIDVEEITQKVINHLKDNIKTTQIDEITSQILATLGTDNYEYQRLAARIIISNHQKNTSGVFSEKITELNKLGLISDTVYQITIENQEFFDNLIDYSRDFLFDFFGFKTLERSYLLWKTLGDGTKMIIERPQDLYLRLSISLYPNDLKKIKKNYDYMSKHYFTHATPTLFNAGTKHQQLASCFLMGCDDSIKGIYKCLSDCAQISKYAGGIGISMSDIRGNGSKIRSTNGNTNGIVPMLKVFNNTALYVNQGGRRPGSIAIYLEPHHPDFIDFLDLRKNHGDEMSRARDLFTAVWISDLFMERVKNNEIWSFMCPDECPGLSDAYSSEYTKLYKSYEDRKMYKSQAPARDIWKAIITSQIETGTPYIVNKDTTNDCSNQKNIGTIKNSNLCVAPETMILTSKGYYQISQLENNEVEVWNGQEFTKTIVKKTGEKQELINIKFTNGTSLDCTKYHNFYITTGKRPSSHPVIKKISAENLKIDMKLIHTRYPIITDGPDNFKYPYEHGLFCADGTYGNKNGTKPRITLYGDKKLLVPHLITRLPVCPENKNGKQEGSTINILLPNDIAQKYTVPINYSLDIKLRWLEGVLDGDGCSVKYGNTEAIQIVSIHKEFLDNMKYLLQTLGCDPKIVLMKLAGIQLLPDSDRNLKEYYCKEQYRLLLTSYDVATLYTIGFRPKRLKINGIFPKKNTKHYIKVQEINDNNRISDTYCFTEKNRGMGIFNGILTGNCAEITLYSSPEEYAVCTLASISLPMCIKNGVFNHNILHDITRQLVRNLDRVIDINFYPVPETRISNEKHRPLGIGVQGLADTFLILKMAYDSPEARELNTQIFETMYYSALFESNILAKELGVYPSYPGSPISQGIFQFDMHRSRGIEVNLSGRWDFESLRRNILEHGVRNSTLIALMPTASTSQILGNIESFEPLTACIFTRKTLAGDFVVVNKNLIRELQTLGIWSLDIKNSIIANNGSVQSITVIPEDIRLRYRTIWEIKQRSLIEMSADRTPFICQTQSMNLYFANPTFAKIHSALMFGWSKGLKTMVYYTRTKAVSSAIAITVDPSCESCSG